MIFKKKLLSQILLLFLILGLVFSPQIALAYDVDFYSANDILFYNPDDASDCYSPSSTDIADGKNIETVLRFFIEQKGLSLEAAAGITGNLMLESGYNINPAALGPDTKYGRPFGIAQWLGGRRTKLETFAEQKNISVEDLSMQLEFLWSELNSSYKKSTLDPIVLAKTPEEAAGIFNDHFEVAGEKPGDPIYVKRQTYAVEAYNLAVELGLVSSTNASSSLSRCDGSSSAGQYGWDLDGPNAMVFYDQSSREWRDKPFGIGTIGACGSGPASLAMIVATLTGDNSVNPENMATFYASHGGQIRGSSCDSTWNWSVIQQPYGVTVTDIGTDLDKAKQTLRNGGLILASWSGAPFTSGGHIIVIRKYSPNGEIFIASSGGATNFQQSQRAWDESIFINGYNDSEFANRGTTGYLKGMWGITKR